MDEMKKKKKSLGLTLLESEGFISVLVVLLGFLAGTILVALVGKQPSRMYGAIFQAFSGWMSKKRVVNVRYIFETFNYAIPYILCGLSMGFAERVGLFNIGAEGQYIMGMTMAQMFALLGPQIPGLHWFTCLLLATMIGAIWGGIVGVLKAKYEVSEVVATIMLNYVALYLSRIICMRLPGANTFRTDFFPETATLTNEFFVKITNNSNLNNGLFFMILCVIVYWFIMEKTSLGYGMRATGFNKDAARASGIPVVKSIALSMAIAGAFAGLAGGIVALGSFRYGRVISGMDGYGFDGIAVALVGNCRALGILLAGYLFGLLKNAQPLMQSRGIPKEITFIIQGLIVVFIALRSGVVIIRQNIDKKRLQRSLEEKEGVR